MDVFQIRQWLCVKIPFYAYPGDVMHIEIDDFLSGTRKVTYKSEKGYDMHANLMMAGDFLKLASYDAGCNTTDAGIDFIENHCWYIVLIHKGALNRQHNTGKFTTRCNFAKWFNTLTLIG